MNLGGGSIVERCCTTRVTLHTLTRPYSYHLRFTPGITIARIHVPWIRHHPGNIWGTGSLWLTLTFICLFVTIGVGIIGNAIRFESYKKWKALKCKPSARFYCAFNRNITPYSGQLACNQKIVFFNKFRSVYHSSSSPECLSCSSILYMNFG